MRLTTEAILEKSKDKALKALLADPVVNNVNEAEKLLNHMIEKQYQTWLFFRCFKSILEKLNCLERSLIKKWQIKYKYYK